MRDINVVKYRKLLREIQFFCKRRKREIYKDYHVDNHGNPNKKGFTDFERGRIDGKYSAYNDVLRRLQTAIEDEDIDWDYIKCREQEKQFRKVIRCIIQMKKREKYLKDI